jgi:hypothetical protein
VSNATGRAHRLNVAINPPAESAAAALEEVPTARQQSRCFNPLAKCKSLLRQNFVEALS